MKHKSFFASRFASFRYAFSGLVYLIVSERNAQIHLASTIAVVLLGIGFGVTVEEWRWLLLTIALVWTGEAFNTAVERLSDAVTLENDPNIGRAKDVAAAAVLIISIFALVVGVTVLGPRILAELQL